LEKLLTTKQVCKALGIYRVTLYKLVKTGRLKAHSIGNAWKFKPSEIERLLESVLVGN
jgi:excisionase family DNA binding protein